MDNTILNQNLQFLKQKYPEIYNAIKNTNVSDISIQVDQDGINIKRAGAFIYPKNATAHLSMKIEQFFTKPTAFSKPPLIFQKDPLTTPIQDYFLEKIEEKIPPKQTQNISYDKNLDSLPIILLFGIGTGQEIEQLISAVDIKSLIIIDNDWKMIKTSMHLINWEPIFEYFSRDSYFLQFEINPNPLVAASKIFFALSSKKIHCSNYIPYFSSYVNSYFTDTFNHMKENYRMLFDGWGFYDDEMLSLSHTIGNLNDKRAIFLNNRKLPDNATVFIVGTGPSLDADIEYIKKHRNKVILFSCGTSLKVFEANDIYPDFHFESERPERMLDYISNNISHEFLKEINFIGVNVIYPEVLKLFKSAKIFFRINDCGSSIIPKNIPKYDYCNPTVVNAALLFASTIGFNNIYLFGTDMGYKDESNHHSKYSSYSDKKSAISKLKPNTISQTFPGNFNKSETFLTTHVFAWCKYRAEYCIKDNKVKKHKHVKYFNCSDGAFIENTISKHAKDIKVSEKPKKDLILKAIDQNFIQDYSQINQKIKNIFQQEKDLLLQTISNLESILDKYKTIDSYSAFFAFLDSCYEQIFTQIENKESSMAFSLLRGTTLHIFSTLYAHALLAHDINQSFYFINNGRNVIEEFFQKVKHDILNYNLI